MSRYEKAPDWVNEMVNEVRAEHFTEIANANILVVMDGQKRTSLGRTIFASMKKASALVNFLAGLGMADGEFDYVLTLDKTIFDRLENEDRRLLIFHELCHCWKDVEDEEETFKIAGHDYEVFGREMRFNPDWLEWWRRMGDFGARCYESTEKPPVNDPRQPNMFNKGDNEKAEQEAA